MQQEFETKTPSKSNNQQISAYGSKEFQQSFDKEFAKTPIINISQLFASIPHQVYQIACGGLHTLVLTTNGQVYSFGNNKDEALGRTGDAKKPGKVELDGPVDMICAGESHSIACNSTNTAIYQWGTYRYFNDTETSRTTTPGRIAVNDIKKKKISKILSGDNHTLVLAEGKVFVWGEAEFGILGRLPSSRRKTDQGLKVETIAVKGPVEDIYTGANHAFLKKTETKKKETHNVILAWGWNDSGQLGIGNSKNAYNPTEVVALRDKNIKSITGGAHHTLVLTSEGEVFSFGRNSNGQLGLGKDYQQPQEESTELETTTTPKAKAPPKNTKKSSKKSSAKEETSQENKEEPGNTAAAVENEEKSETEQKTEETSQPAEAVQEPDTQKTGSFLVWTPQKIELIDIERIFSGGDSNYAVTKNGGVYCWGSAQNHLLPPGNTESLYLPTQLNGGLWNSQPIRQIELGKEHVVILAADDDAQLEEAVNQETGKSTKKGTTGKKGQNTTTAKKSKSPKDEDKAPEPEEEIEDVKKDLNQALEDKTIEEETVAQTSPNKEKKSLKKKASEDDDDHQVKKVKITPTNPEVQENQPALAVEEPQNKEEPEKMEEEKETAEKATMIEEKPETQENQEETKENQEETIIPAQPETESQEPQQNEVQEEEEVQPTITSTNAEPTITTTNADVSGENEAQQQTQEEPQVENKEEGDEKQNE